eukprot:CAMPEP_0183377010 /NCGR_PEP_ID=MMETSP0164_2-20130417/121892_1 /TAXON_ID=221442 /ORGANISM="Coccolithus pelagicus ssp braarudi, Strain PLY182g" /LENGTH=53 /DNA_ID=CAMNT_0025554419 /DNA_START=293 /DNA_END=452 /DNA_ORIENTATION=-
MRYLSSPGWLAVPSHTAACAPGCCTCAELDAELQWFMPRPYLFIGSAAAAEEA